MKQMLTVWPFLLLPDLKGITSDVKTKENFKLHVNTYLQRSCRTLDRPNRNLYWEGLNPQENVLTPLSRCSIPPYKEHRNLIWNCTSKETGTKHLRTVNSKITVSLYNQRPRGCIAKPVQFQSTKEHLLTCNCSQLYPGLDLSNVFYANLKHVI